MTFGRRALKRALFFSLCIYTSISLSVSPAEAATPNEVLQSLGLATTGRGSAKEVELLQKSLSWIGVFRGQINGNVDKPTREAISRFQRAIGARETGQLTSRQMETLSRRARDTERRASFRNETIEWVGMRLDLPQNYIEGMSISGDDKTDIVIRGRDAAYTVIFLERWFGSYNAPQWITTIKRWSEERKHRVLVSGVSGQIAYAVSEGEDRRTYWLYVVSRGETRGIEITLNSNSVWSLRPMIGRIIQSFEPFAATGARKSQIPARIRSGDYPGAELQPDWYLSMIGNGSGSIVSRRGHVLTNHHVIAGCEWLTVNGVRAELVGSDVGLDLAVIRAPQLEGREPIRFADRAIELGEFLLVLGYPVYNISPSLNATTGIVSSSTGFRGDRTRIQMTAPVQPGNSGGPVISRNGAQVGVVASKVSAAAQAQSNIENIGYAVRSAEAEDFLESHGIRPVIARDAFEMVDKPMAEKMRVWRRMAVRVECHK